MPIAPITSATKWNTRNHRSNVQIKFGRNVMEAENIQVEMTPNPNAWKFVLPGPVIAEGNATFRSFEDARDIPLAAALIRTGHVTQVYFFDNYITISQDGDISWDILADVIRTRIADFFDNHDPSSVTPDKSGPLSFEINQELLERINKLLEETVRPALQGDGGDMQIAGFDDVTKTLKIAYQGACGSCPSATAGTLVAIQSILQESIDPEITVTAV